MMQVNRQQHEKCVVCSHAIQLTAQETIGQLQDEITKVLMAIPSVSHFRGFDVSGTLQDTQQALQLYAYAKEQSDVTLIAEHVLSHRALQSGQIQHDVDGQRCLYFVPLEYAPASHGLWFIECDEVVAPNDLVAIETLVAVYKNCASHIGLQNTDPLTGLGNRQALSDRLNKILKKGERHQRSNDRSMPSLCILDIDFFKRVNDDYGHLYGDEVLLLFASLMQKTFRDNDFICRYGGEEFVVLLASTGDETARVALERFRQAVADYEFPQVGNITVSSGFVQMQAGVLPSSTVDQADVALYYAKDHGRNRVESYDELLQQGHIEVASVDADSELF